MSTAVLLYGMALLYGATGATTLVDISRVLTGPPSPAALLSVTMLVAGLGFKIAAAPFQLWTPDVYQGAATPATAFFSVGSKAAGFAVILRIFNGALPGISAEWAVLFGVLAFITMTVGNLVAIVQTNIKRLMAYSSITHVGLHADRPGGGQRRRLERGDVLPAGVRVHESRRVHRHHDHGQLRARRRDLRATSGWRSARRCWRWV